MGRWAFFSTGIEYKFAFATQCSTDITRFGGLDKTAAARAAAADADAEAVSGDYVHEWDSKRHLPDVEYMLDLLEVAYNIKRPLISSYDKTPDGTQTLLSDAYDLLDNYGEYIYRYILGLIIYHQLLYTDTLIARYEG